MSSMRWMQGAIRLVLVLVQRAVCGDDDDDDDENDDDNAGDGDGDTQNAKRETPGHVSLSPKRWTRGAGLCLASDAFFEASLEHAHLLLELGELCLGIRVQRLGDKDT